MTTIEEAIVEWSQSRPPWLQVLFREVCTNGTVSDESLHVIMDSMVAGTLESKRPHWQLPICPLDQGRRFVSAFGASPTLRTLTPCLAGER